MDLSLHDALTDGAPQSGPDNPVRRDFMASLEKETFDDKVGETVEKTDYRPLLDGKDGKGSSMKPGGQMGTGMQRQEPMGEKRPCPTGQQAAFNADYLSGPVSSMMGKPGEGNQDKGMKDSNMPDSLMVKAENKDKQEKADFFPKTDNLNIFEKTEKSDKMEKKEKEDESKKVDNADKTSKSEKILKDEEKFHKTEKNYTNEKVDKPEKTNKDEKMEKKENGEKTDKMVKAENNEKAGKGTAKSQTTNGSKQDLTSPDSKAKTPENGPPVPKANGTANKNGSSTTATTKPAGPRPSASAPSLRRNTVPKTDDTKPGDVKKPSTLKTTPTKPRVPRTSATAPSTPATNGEQPRRRITKPPVPKQTAMERKPPVPRAPRTPRPINAPLPDLKNVRSKIGSTDNMKYQPTGGKVSSAGASQSKDGPGKVQIQHKKVDLSKVTSKCGSKDNIKHKPGGGDVKNEAKANGNGNGKPKVGSMDNIGLEAGDGPIKAVGMLEKAAGKTSPPGGAPATGAGSMAKENGNKATPPPNPFGGDPMGMNKRIPETN